MINRCALSLIRVLEEIMVLSMEDLVSRPMQPVL